MAEIGLDGAGIDAIIGQLVAASVSEHVRVSLELQLCLLACSLNQRLKAPGRERITALAIRTRMVILASGRAVASAMRVTQRRSMDAWPVCLIRLYGRAGGPH